MSTNCVPFKITVAGKEIEAYMKESDWKYITRYTKNTGYERVEQGKEYWCVCANGDLDDQIEEMCSLDINCYDAANYYSSKAVAEDNARADKLMRQLRRFAVEHRNNGIDWNNEERKYCIRYGHCSGEIIRSSEVKGHDFGGIYFDSMEAVDLAIETFYDELIWYFTEYKDSLGEYWV